MVVFSWKQNFLQGGVPTITPSHTWRAIYTSSKLTRFSQQLCQGGKHKSSLHQSPKLGEVKGRSASPASSGRAAHAGCPWVLLCLFHCSVRIRGIRMHGYVFSSKI